MTSFVGWLVGWFFWQKIIKITTAHPCRRKGALSTCFVHVRKLYLGCLLDVDVAEGKEIMDTGWMMMDVWPVSEAEKVKKC